MSALNDLTEHVLKFAIAYREQHGDLVARCFRLENLANSEMEARDRISRHADRLEQRLEKMEKALSEEMAKTREMDDILAGVVKKVGYESPPATLDQKTLDDIVANPGDYEVKVEGISAYSIQPSLPLYANWIGDIRAAKDESWHIHIDPKASPSDIPFSVALEYLKAGRIVTRSNWQNRARVEPRSSGAVGGLRVIHAASLDYGPFEPCLTDLLATNWMVLSEQP